MSDGAARDIRPEKKHYFEMTDAERESWVAFGELIRYHGGREGLEAVRGFAITQMRKSARDKEVAE